MFNRFISYLERIIDSKHTDDSKVFVGLLAFMYVLFTGYYNLFTGKAPDFQVFYGILGLTISVFGLTTFVKVRSITAKTDIAASVVKEDSSTEVSDNAKDILSSDKPS